MPYRLAKGVCVFALVVSALGGSARALTIEAYLDLAKRKESTNSLDRYFDGLRDGVMDYNAAMLSAGIKVFCPPEGKAALAPAELRTKIDAWLKGSERTEPTFAEYAKSTPVGLVALEVLNDLYACPIDEGGGAVETVPPR